jgi:hypothetical protein
MRVRLGLELDVHGYRRLAPAFEDGRCPSRQVQLRVVTGRLAERSRECANAIGVNATPHARPRRRARS